jgi:nitrate reductase NapE
MREAASEPDLRDPLRSSSDRRRELLTFLFLTVLLAPALAVAIVGGWGFLVWVYQMIYGPPGPPAV